MTTLLFIPALLSGDIDGFMVEVALVMLLWLIVISASMFDLVTGIAASKQADGHQAHIFVGSAPHVKQGMELFCWKGNIE